MKKNEGITLIALIITIIILIILTAITISNVMNSNLFGLAKGAAENYVQAGEEEQDKIDELTSYLGSENGKVKVNKPRLSDGMIPIKYDEEKQNWVITNEKDEEWYDYSEGKMLWANVMLSDGAYKEKEKNYTDDGTTEIKEEELGSMFVWVPRYAYSINSYHTEMNGGEGTTQKITNVVFLNGTSDKDFEGKSYPREYNVDEMLEKVGQPTPMIVHPGFTFGEEELTGIWVGKFEASMSGTNGNTKDTNNIETNNTPADEHSIKVLPNVNTWRYIAIGNCFFNCLNMSGDNNIYGITKTKVDTHLMKNIEWGAASYLAASQYGNVPTVNDSINREGLTDIYYEYTGKQNYIENVSQSTTRNITGIYDMSGGTWEYTSAYFDNFDQSLAYGLNAFEETQRGIELKSEYTKYWDRYDVGVEEKKVTKENGIFRNHTIWDSGIEGNQKRKDASDERYKLMKNKIGDAMYETIRDYAYYGRIIVSSETQWDFEWLTSPTGTTQNWGRGGYYNGDYSLIGCCYCTYILRGGVWSNTAEQGMFAICTPEGYILRDRTFRPVIAV